MNTYRLESPAFPRNPARPTGSTPAPHSSGPNTPRVALILAAASLVALTLALPHSRPDPAAELAQIRHLAHEGESSAQLLLGLAYLEGRDGLAVSKEKGMFWLERSAREGDSYAANRLGELYAQGQGIAADPVAALSWWQQAAKQGSPTAQLNLAQAYRDGRGTAVDPVAALKWANRAADRGNPEAHRVLLDLYRGGYASAADLDRGDNRAMRMLAAALPDTAERLQERAQEGDPRAQYQLAWRYRTGAWAVSRDEGKALLWFTRAAESGNLQAMHALDEIYRKGLLGVGTDTARADVWQQRARKRERMEKELEART